MSVQIGILKVLSTYPAGQASIAAIKQDLAMLASREWSVRLRVLAKLAPQISIFSAGFIVRAPEFWQITDAGKEFLARIEAGERVEAGVTRRSSKRKEMSKDDSAELRARPQRPLRQYRPGRGSGRHLTRRIQKFVGHMIRR